MQSENLENKTKKYILEARILWTDNNLADFHETVRDSVRQQRRGMAVLFTLNEAVNIR